jgi:hypothetical protein
MAYGEVGLALDDDSGFTIGSFIAAVHASVPTTVTREQVLATLLALQDSYDSPNLEKRLALLADDCRVEDPAGLPRGGGKAGMEAFFRSTWDNGVRLNRIPRERIIVGNEAIEHIAMVLEKDGLEPHPLAHMVHYTFDDSGRIRSIRVFFDMKSIFRQPEAKPDGGW